MSAEHDFQFGGLFKKSGFFKSSSSNSWGKRFFIFNRRTMLLQYWAADEERYYKVEGSVRTQPKSSISLLSSTLTIQAAPVERTMFGQKYPIIISNGPAFGKRTLILAATSPNVREAWIGVIRGAFEELKEKQKMAVVQKKIITNPKHPEYKSLDNQHRIMMEKETQLKDLDIKIGRALVQTDLMKAKDNRLYNTQEKLRKTHRETEDKLYSLTCEETHPQWRFKFIDTGYAYAIDTMLDTLPLGIYRHTAPAWVNTKFHRPKSETIIKPEDQPASIHKRLYGIHQQISNKKHKVRYLEDAEYYPYNTDNMIVDNIDKHFDDSNSAAVLKEPLKQGFEIRELDKDVYEDPDMLSLREMQVFKMLKKENTKQGLPSGPGQKLLRKLDRKDVLGYKTHAPYDKEQRINEMDEKSRALSEVMDFSSDCGYQENVRDHFADQVDKYETRDKVYKVDGKGRRF